jgi:hypothetical protein
MRLPDQREHGDITALLGAWSEGDPGAFDRVMPLVYDELHRMPARFPLDMEGELFVELTLDAFARNSARARSSQSRRFIRPRRAS